MAEAAITNDDPQHDLGVDRHLQVNASDLGAPRFFQSMSDQVWAVQSAAVLQELAHIAQRHGSMESVERLRAQQADDAQTVRIRNGVAIVPLIGPIFPRANLFTMISGATSIDVMARDLQKMADRSDIRAILLEIDSPGGAVTDIDEMAGVISDIARQKPVTAYVGGTAASAAYWLATAAGEIVVTRTGQVGSIGVVATVAKQTQPDESGILDFEIVSSNAPEKRPDPETETGRQAVVERIDPIERLFIDTVAANRGVTAARVREDFGRGGVVVGSTALDRAMADRVATFEETLTGLEQHNSPDTSAAAAAANPSKPQEAEMTDKTEVPAEAPTSADDPQSSQVTGTDTDNAADPADIAKLCAEAGVAEQAESLIRNGASMATARQSVNAIGTMRERATAAVSAGMLSQDKVDELFGSARKQGKTPDEFAAELFESACRSQSADADVQSRISPDANVGGGDVGWDQAAAKVAAQFKR